jgi:hypothetical protein
MEDKQAITFREGGQMIRNRRARTRHNHVDPKRLNGSKIHFTFDDVVTQSGCIPRGMDKCGLALEARKVYGMAVMLQTDWFKKSALTEIKEDKDEKEN